MPGALYKATRSRKSRRKEIAWKEQIYPGSSQAAYPGHSYRIMQHLIAQWYSLLFALDTAWSRWDFIYNIYNQYEFYVYY